MNEITFRFATAADWPAIAQVLSAAKLPLDGAEAHVHSFLLALSDTHLLGTAALEKYGTSALLRSVAVTESQRGTGLGHELTRRTLDLAHAAGITQVVLLTTTAARFFRRFGFEVIEREQVPEAMLASAEFKGACPASAVLMGLDLTRPPVTVRLAAPTDVPAITRIYNQGIEDQSTFETVLRTEEERLNWLTSRSLRHPVIVAIMGGEVVGWASLNPFSPREAYRWVADLSVYIERGARGTGIGTVLMHDLIARAKALDYHKLVLTTFPHSTGAVKLYGKLGFRHVGDYKEQGLLGNVWTDTRIMERIL